MVHDGAVLELRRRDDVGQAAAAGQVVGADLDDRLPRRHEVLERHVGQVVSGLGVAALCLLPVRRVQDNQVGFRRGIGGPARRDVVGVDRQGRSGRVQVGCPHSSAHALRHVDRCPTTGEGVEHHVSGLSPQPQQVLDHASRHPPEVAGRPIVSGGQVPHVEVLTGVGRAIENRIPSRFR